MSEQQRHEHRVHAAQEAYFRVCEFRAFVDANALFPAVSDAIVRPMRQGLLDAEHRLLAYLSDYGALDHVLAVRKTLAKPPEAGR